MKHCFLMAALGKYTRNPYDTHPVITTNTDGTPFTDERTSSWRKRLFSHDQVHRTNECKAPYCLFLWSYFVKSFVYLDSISYAYEAVMSINIFCNQ